MSSTNRGKERHKYDYYVTPIQPIKDFLQKFIATEQLGGGQDLLIADVCAGGDPVNPMSYPEAIKSLGLDEKLLTLDIREDSRAEVKGDYLEYAFKDEPDVIITNPPFNMALDMIRKALEDVKDGGYVAMLLRLNFIGSKGRKSFFDENMPKYLFIHHERISFTGDGKKDSIEYAHFVWQKNYKGDTKVFLL